MKKPILIIHFLLLYLPSLLWCQVIILPEIGFSYLPFTFTTANTSTISNKLDYLVGISARMPIHHNFELSSRISFSDRHDIHWIDLCTCPGYLGEEFRHSDLNFDVSILYTKDEKLNFGLGPSAIRKFAQWETWNDIYDDNITLLYHNKFFFGLNSNVIFVLQRVGFKITYIRIISNLGNYFSPTGQNRFDMTVSYDLLKKS
ncbi:MAG: hypothetical protein WAT91_10125 [Saprospiraceae bacterium]